MQYDERWLADALATRAYGASGPIQVLKVSRGTPGSLVGIVFGVGPITGEGWINSLPEAWDDVPWFVRFEMQTDDGTPVFHLLRFPNLVITGARSTPLAPPVPPPLPVRGGPQDAPGRGARESVPEAPLIPPGEPPPPPATRPPPARPPVQSPAQRRLAMLNRRDLRAAPGPPKGPDTLHALSALERSAAGRFLSEDDDVDRDADDPSSDSPPAPPPPPRPPPPPPPGPGARQPAVPEDATLRTVEGRGPGIKLRVLIIDTAVTLSHKHPENPSVGRRVVVADRDADIGLIWCWAPEAFQTVDTLELGRTYLLTDVLVKAPAAGRGNPPFYLHYGLRTKRRCMPAHLEIAYPPAVAVRSRRTANWFQEYSTVSITCLTVRCPPAARTLRGATQIQVREVELSDADGCGIKLELAGDMVAHLVQFSEMRVCRIESALARCADGAWNLVGSRAMHVTELPVDAPEHEAFVAAWQQSVSAGRYHFLDDWDPAADPAHGLDFIGAHYREREGGRPTHGYVAVILEFGPKESRDPFTRLTCSLPEHRGSRLQVKDGRHWCPWRTATGQQGHECETAHIWDFMVVMGCEAGCCSMAITGDDGDDIFLCTAAAWASKSIWRCVEEADAKRTVMRGKAVRVWARLGQDRPQDPAVRVVRLELWDPPSPTQQRMIAALTQAVPPEDLLSRKDEWELAPLGAQSIKGELA